MTTPSVVLNSGSKKTPRKGKIPKIVAFVYASSQGQRTHSARTNYLQTVPRLPPKGNFVIMIFRVSNKSISLMTYKMQNHLCFRIINFPLV